MSVASSLLYQSVTQLDKIFEDYELANPHIGIIRQILQYWRCLP